MKRRRQNVDVGACGIFINSNLPFMAASPDGIYSCSCSRDGCVEIKCPFTYRCLYVDDVIDKDNDFCLQKETGGRYMLKMTHPYDLQVQSKIVSHPEFLLQLCGPHWEGLSHSQDNQNQIIRLDSIFLQFAQNVKLARSITNNNSVV